LKTYEKTVGINEQMDKKNHIFISVMARGSILQRANDSSIYNIERLEHGNGSAPSDP
jgi:hypothetical protein